MVWETLIDHLGVKRFIFVLQNHASFFEKQPSFRLKISTVKQIPANYTYECRTIYANVDILPQKALFSKRTVAAVGKVYCCKSTEMYFFCKWKVSSLILVVVG